jgi:hypothetical protein
MSTPKAKSSNHNSLLATLRDNVQNHKNKRLAESEKVSSKKKQAKVARATEIDSLEAKLRSDVLRFNEEGFIVIEDDLEFIVPELSVSEGSDLLKSWKKDFIKVFFAINSIKMFEKLKVFINNEATRMVTTNSVAESTTKYYKQVTIDELIRFIGIHILLENAFSNHTPTMEENYQSIKEKFEFDMGYNRFSAIKACIKPTNQEFDVLLKEWVSQSKVHWVPGTNVSVDESIYAYDVRQETKKKFEQKKDPIPVHYIPRKPHKKGLLSWTLAVKSAHTNKPYVLDILPHYRYI